MQDTSTIRALLRPEVFELAAYQVADATGLIKLDAMENPYPWPQAMVDEWLEVLRRCQPNRYPDPEAGALKTLLRAHNAIPESAGLMLGNGSDELIQIILMAIAGRDAVVVAPEPTFVMYRQLAHSLGIRFVGVPLLPDSFELDRAALRQALVRWQPAVVFLAYPNNPTGNLFEREAVLELLAQAPGLVVLDEAYAPFAEASFMADLLNHDRLLVMRTLSKLGLAGLRLGFLAGPKDWLVQLDKLRLPYNINVLTQLSAEFALSHQPVFDQQTQQICRDRESLAAELSALSGLTVFPSQANFILFRCERIPAGEVFAALKAAGILIKNMAPVGGLLANCLRVTVGTPTENAAFIGALRQALANT